MIERGPYAFFLRPSELSDLIDEAGRIFDKEQALVKIPRTAINVIGAIRGQYRDLFRWFQICGWPPRNRCIFLGELITEGSSFSLETLSLICAMKIMMPYDVYVIRGCIEARRFRFAARFSRQICDALAEIIRDFCHKLPIAATIGGRILAVHGGPSPEVKTLEEISKIRKSLQLDAAANHFIFSRMDKDVENYKVIKTNPRGVLFGDLAIRKACENLGVDLIIRSHNPHPKGYSIHADRKLISIWSAPNTKCEAAACLRISAENVVSIVQLVRKVSSRCASEENMGTLTASSNNATLSQANKRTTAKSVSGTTRTSSGGA
ncbi:hypothetical protein AB6A40_007541 [Gnathostoma spinigerum]|uniref:Serine/threonine specific protein phosphatases domain-containing protein n=1 Tax=Gnathostoma spinigerum TaxID=75299 RepID=A0ABD6ENQ4_9BILA